MKIVISSQIELPPSLFVRRCFDAFERNNNRLSSLINHAQLTSIETCHFFSPSLVSASQLIIRCVSHRNEGPLSHRKRPSTEVIVAQVEIQYIECSASARFCPLFLSHAASSPLHTFSLSTHSRPVHGLSTAERVAALRCVQYPSTHRHCARVAARFIEKPLSLSREGRATTEIAGELFVSRGRGIHRVHGRESFFPRVVG